MRNILFMGLVVGMAGSLAAVPQAAAKTFDRGQALYEHHCMECHESWAHERRSRKVATLADLRKRVAGWSLHSSLGWGDEEINDVTDYLNRTFYNMRADQ